MWLFSGAPIDPEDDAVRETNGAEAMYSTMKSPIHAIWSEDNVAWQDLAHWTIEIAKAWTVRRLLESKLMNGQQFCPNVQMNTHLSDLRWTEDEK